jgi:PAS domain S-box-containing protein
MQAAYPAKLPVETLEDLFENAPCGYISTRPDGLILRVNQTFLNMTGDERATLEHGTRIQDLMTKPGQVFYDTHFGPMIRIQGTVKEIACDLVKADEKRLPVLMNAVQVLDAAGEPMSIRFTVFDATERRRFEADLIAARKRAEQLAAVIEISADPIVSLGPDGRLLSWNGEAERVFGFKQTGLQGGEFWTLVKAEGAETFAEIFEELKLGRPIERFIFCSDRGGERMEMFMKLTPQIEPPGDVISVSAILRNVTERRRMLQVQHRRELLENLVKTQELERQRIARDLHDQLGQQLTALRLELAEFRESAADLPEMRRRVESIQQQAVKIDRDVTFLAFELRPAVLDSVGFANAVEGFVAEWSRNYGIAAEFHGSEIELLDPEIETNLYRIIQEALNNVLKHARAQNVSVTINRQDGNLRLIIEDDGIGFDNDEPDKQKTVSGHGHGLAGIKERAAVMEGTVEIETRASAGTSIFVSVPLEGAPSIDL